MKSKLILLVALVILLVLAGGVLAQPNPSSSPHSAQWYSVEQSTLTGNNYHLASRVWQFDPQASGGDYRLQSLTTPDLRGNGCCCTFLPCQWRNATP